SCVYTTWLFQVATTWQTVPFTGGGAVLFAADHSVLTHPAFKVANRRTKPAAATTPRTPARGTTGKNRLTASCGRASIAEPPFPVRPGERPCSERARRWSRGRAAAAAPGRTGPR